jgi:hypothetical protein
MSAAYFIVLERKIDGLDTMMNGKSLSKHMRSLDQAAEDLGVHPLSGFYSVDPEQAAEFWADEGVQPGDVKLPPLEQFSAQDGLATVSALLAHTPVHKDHVLEDLQECERILTAAAEHGVGWHFEVDI